MTNINSRYAYSRYIDLYKLAFFITQRDYKSYIINIGPPNKKLLQEYSRPFNIINISHEPLDDGQEGAHIENIYTDYVKFPTIHQDILKRSVVIATGLFSEGNKNSTYLKYLRHLAKTVDYMIVAEQEEIAIEGFRPSHQIDYKKLVSITKKYLYTGGCFGWTKSDSITKDSFVALCGNAVRSPKNLSLPKKTLLVIMTAYNEVDIIEQSIRHAVDQGADIHVVDNWSDDGTYETIQKLKNKFGAKITCERFPEKKPTTHVYKWADLLARVGVIAEKSGYDWIMHNDADELRIAPWKEVSFVDAVSYVDSLGYTAIDLTVADFRPTTEGFSVNTDPENFFTHFELLDKGGYFTQIKCWKNVGKVDLVRTGGHHAEFENQRIYPIKFFTKHYPIRSSAQGNKKIFAERKENFDPQEKKRGWHIQYDQYDAEQSFVWSPDELYAFKDGEFWEKLFIERISGIGIRAED